MLLLLLLLPRAALCMPCVGPSSSDLLQTYVPLPTHPPIAAASAKEQSASAAPAEKGKDKKEKAAAHGAAVQQPPAKKPRFAGGGGARTSPPRPPPPSKQPLRPPAKQPAAPKAAATADAATAACAASLGKGGISAVSVRNAEGVSALLAVRTRQGASGLRAFALRTQWRDLGLFGDASPEYNKLTDSLGKKEVRRRPWPWTRHTGTEAQRRAAHGRPAGGRAPRCALSPRALRAFQDKCVSHRQDWI